MDAHISGQLANIYCVLTEIRDALKPTVVDKPSTTEPPIPPPVRLEEWKLHNLEMLEKLGWYRVVYDIQRQIDHLRARKERGEDV